MAAYELLANLIGALDPSIQPVLNQIQNILKAINGQFVQHATEQIQDLANAEAKITSMTQQISALGATLTGIQNSASGCAGRIDEHTAQIDSITSELSKPNAIQQSPPFQELKAQVDKRDSAIQSNAFGADDRTP